jgi:2-polyprenyl-3-methyl-5-hydroxy-6-metoxy-1,4-benzoquinol methylase
MDEPKAVEQRVRAGWDANARKWAEQIRRGEDLYRHRFLEPEFMGFVGGIAGLEVLDAGCGEGTSSRCLAAAGAKVSAVDLSPQMIANALAEEAARPRGIAYGEASVERLPFADARFDVVTSWMALSDMSCYADAMKEFARVLKPGGRLFFCIRHPCYFTSRMAVVRRSRAELPYLLVGDYFREAPWTERWSFAGGREEAEGRASFSNVRFPYTLSDCLNGAGLVLRAVREPKPSEELCRAFPRLVFWRTQAALYLFVAAARE